MADYEVTIVGGGLAGLTAGLFAARCGRSTLVLTSAAPGGHLSTVEHVEDFPGFPEGVAGFELGPKVQEQAAAAGAEFRLAEVSDLRQASGDWLLTMAEGEVSSAAVILATGSRPRALGVPGEERFEGRGISHCASCDGPLLRGGPAVVVGGGDSAFQEALTLAGYGSEVAIVHRFETSPAQEAYQRRVREQTALTVHHSTDVLELVGEETLTGVKVIHEETREESLLPAAGVWVYAGLQADTDLVAGLLSLDEHGRVPVDLWLRTAARGLFAAGDVRSDSASQAVSAAGDGATAAVAADRYLELGSWTAAASYP